MKMLILFFSQTQHTIKSWLIDPDTLDFENTQLKQRRAKLEAERARKAEKKG